MNEAKLHKAPTSKTGGRRVPVLLHKDGEVERVQTTPQFGGLLIVSRDVPMVFHLGKWASDAGFPKLRWVDHCNPSA